MVVIDTWGRAFTVQDLDEQPDDGRRWELVDGVVIVTPAPGFSHQNAVASLMVLLRQAVPEDLVVLAAPFDWQVDDATRFQPDLLAFRRADSAPDKLRATPLLVVEVLSPSTRRVDLGIKKLAFEEEGVPSYWIVDPHEPGLTAFRLDAGGRYEVEAEVRGSERFLATQPFTVEVVPAQLVEGAPR